MPMLDDGACLVEIVEHIGRAVSENGERVILRNDPFDSILNFGIPQMN
jgi:hypothetical protein